ncbi:hypothetical protein IFR05_014865 [Cadophora sp. M221]|nr:hypothetical protein IFR05_014865 [Cadophora sp. M221]
MSKIFEIWDGTGRRYPRQQTAVEQHIRATYGNLAYRILQDSMPGVTDLMEHIDGDVLHKNDDVVLEFRRSYVNDCNMTSVAGAIVTQVAITALSLPSLSQTHWVARACFVISLVSGTLSVFFAVLLQRTIGALYEARTIRIWLSNANSFPSVDELLALHHTCQQILDNATIINNQQYAHAVLEVEGRFSTLVANQEKSAVASLLSALVLEMPKSLINLALGAFLSGLAVYFGFTWTRDLDPNAGPGDSRSVFIVFVIAVFCCLAMYALPATLKASDEYVGMLYRRLGSSIMNVKRQAPHEIPSAISPEEVAIIPVVGIPILASDHQAGPEPGPGPEERNEMTPLSTAIRRAIKAHEEVAKTEKLLAEEYEKIIGRLPGRNVTGHAVV